MEKLLILLAAILLVVLGARGTYKAVWNGFFPNEQIVTTPVSTQTAAAGGQTVGGSTTGGQPGQTATNPVQVGQQAGAATHTGGSNTAHTVPAPASVNPVESIGTTKQAVLSTGIPSWWPSWLPWPGTLIGYYPGEGQTGQVVNNPYAP